MRDQLCPLPHPDSFPKKIKIRKKRSYSLHVSYFIISYHNESRQKDKILKIAQQIFKLDPKEQQLVAIESYLGGQDTVLVAPTRFGKSLIYQIAPFLSDEGRYITQPVQVQPPQHNTVLLTTSSSTTRTLHNSNSSLSSINSSTNLVSSNEQLLTSTPRKLNSAYEGDDEKSILNLSKDLSSLDLAPTRELPAPATKHRGTFNKVRVTKSTFAQFLIIMPLVALITDAIAKVRDITPQVSAIHLCAATAQQARSAVLIFTSPESILDGTSRALLQTTLNIKAVFVDEFHMIERWGCPIKKTAAFRSAYGQLGILRAFIRNAPFICLSATATAGTIGNISSSLLLNQPNIIKISINKRNITYYGTKVTGSILDDFNWLITLLKRPVSILPRIIIFFNNVNRLIDAYQYVTYNSEQEIGSQTPYIVMFHLVTDPVTKQRVIADLGEMTGNIKCVFCSSSLSMGLNLADITYVVHYGAPLTADAFLQESGRAAREIGSTGHSILLNFTRMNAGRKADATMISYKNEVDCRRRVLLSHFNCEKPEDQENCCDICDPSLTCEVLTAVKDSFEDTIIDSFSDSFTVASVADLEDFE